MRTRGQSEAFSKIKRNPLMADNVELASASGGANIKTDDDGTAHWQNVKVAFGDTDNHTRVDATNPLPVNLAGTDATLNAGAVDAGTQRVTIATDDTVTVDWAGTAPPIGAGVEATALRVTLATDSTGLVSVDDGGGALTVDNDGTFAVQDSTLATNTTDIPNVIGTDGSTGPTKAVSMAGTDSLGDLYEIATDTSGHLQVDVLSGGGGGTQYTLGTDTYTEATSVGTLAGAVRNDILAPLADTDNEVAPLQVNADGALYVDEPNVISTDNSTTATLTSSSTFTGTGEDASGHSSITIQVDASHDSSAGGMTFQFSTDNTNWDDSYAFTYTATDGARRFQFPVTAQYFRCVYTNGGTGQTHFRMQTILHRHNIAGSVHRIGDNTDPDRSAALSKSAIVAQAAGSGDFIPVAATASGNFKVALEENDAGNLTTNTVQLGGNAIDVGNGAVGSATQRVTIASDSTGALTVDNAGTFSVQVSAVTPDLMLGTDFSAVLGTADLTTTGTLADAVATTQDVLNTRNFNYVYNGTTFDLMRESSSAGSLLVDVVNTSLTVDLGANNDVQGMVAEGAAVTGTSPFLIAGDDGTNVKNIAVDASGNVQVDVISAPSTAVTNAGTFVVQEDGAALTALQLIDDAIYVDDADFTADTSKLMLGGAVRDDEVGATEVTTEGDVTALRCNKFGQLKTTALADATSEIKYAVIDDAVSGDNTLVAAAGAGIKIRVLSLFLVSAGTVNVTFESSVAGPSLTGAMNLVANSGFSLPFNPGGWFETADNALLNMILSAAISVDGCLSYVEV
jgi:hypothetical protein